MNQKKQTGLSKKVVTLLGLLMFVACGGSSGPGIDSISPDRGTKNGGTQVTIEGSNFVNIIRVEVGNVECVSVDIVSEEELTCVTGSNPNVITNAIVDVEVLNENGDQDTKENAFTYTTN